MLGQTSADSAATPRRCPSVPRPRHEYADLPNQPRCAQPPDRASFWFVAAPEIEMPNRAQPRDLPPPCEAARRRDGHEEAAITPTKSDLKFFVSRSV